MPISYWSDNPELSQCTSKNKQMKGLILLERLKDNAMLPQTNQCSVYDRVNAFAFDMRYRNPTPTDVIATTRGKCLNSQREYTPILPFSRRANRSTVYTIKVQPPQTKRYAKAYA